MGSIFPNYITNPAQGLGIFLAPVAITAADLVADRLAVKSRPARKLLEGEPVIFVKNGKLVEENISKMHYNIDEVLAALRYKGIYNLSDLEFAVLEVDGSISVLEKSQSRPVAPKDLNIPTQYEGLPSVVISDGKILFENLRKNNLNNSWLENNLRDNIAIGLRIRKERKKFRLTREEFAEIIDLSEYYIGQLERGERQASHIYEKPGIYDHNNSSVYKEIKSLLEKCSPKSLKLIAKVIATILPYIGRSN